MIVEAFRTLSRIDREGVALQGGVEAVSIGRKSLLYIFRDYIILQL